MTATRGVLYQATGLRRYLALCACSVQSLRWSGYCGAIRVLVDTHDIPESVFAGLDVELHVVSVPSQGAMNSRWIKTRLHEYSIFDETLFLDCDIIVLNSIDRVWQEMGDADFALAPCYYRVKDSVHASKVELEYTLAQGVRGTQYNGGVNVWRDNYATRRFFAEWHAEWQRFGHIDQLALLRALKKCPLRLHELSPLFNTMTGDSALQLQSEGVFFWHVLAGRDIEIFRATFGTLFGNHWRALGLSSHDLRAPHHARVRRNLIIRHCRELALQRLRSLKHRLRYGERT